MCDGDEGWKLGAMILPGDWLWQTRVATNAIWPLQVTAPNGLRFARETLLLKRTADRYKHLVGVKDLQGQMVTVYDGANANVVFESPLTPIFDGGGNVAFSPSGQRVAIINDGAIQVFQLPAPAAPKAVVPKPPAPKPDESQPFPKPGIGILRISPQIPPVPPPFVNPKLITSGLPVNHPQHSSIDGLVILQRGPMLSCFHYGSHRCDSNIERVRYRKHVCVV